MDEAWITLTNGSPVNLKTITKFSVLGKGKNLIIYHNISEGLGATMKFSFVTILIAQQNFIRVRQGLVNIGAFRDPLPLPESTITALDVVSGTSVGGTAVQISGTDLTYNGIVTFGGTLVDEVSLVSSAAGLPVTPYLLVKTPAHAVGVVDIVYTDFLGRPALLAGAYTYV